jgi:hypothetical protein
MAILYLRFADTARKNFGKNEVWINMSKQCIALTSHTIVIIVPKLSRPK